MIKPLYDNVLIKKEVLENRTASGIIVSTSNAQQDNVGRVVAVGEGKIVDGKRIPVDVSVNDKVIFSKYSTEEVEINNEKYYLLSADKILAVIE